MKKYEGETLVTVCSALGMITGTFYWPTKCLAMLDFWNASSQGFYFKWEKVDDLAIQDVTTLGKAETPDVRALRLQLEKKLGL